MEKIVELLRKEPSREITLAELASERLMPWAHNGRTIREILERDRKGPNILQSKIKGRGSQRRYFVRAEHLITYLEMYGAVLMAHGPKRNNHGKQKRGRSTKATAKRSRSGRGGTEKRKARTR